MADFVLQPFSKIDAPELSLSGRLWRHDECLYLTLRLSGRLDDLSIPEPSPRPGRRSGLWEDTCFELFLAPVGSIRYWEVNASPSGDWNVFAFEDYRLGMREERAVGSLPFTVEHRGNELIVALSVHLPPLLAGMDLQAGVSAIIHRPGWGLSYWALCHRGPKPDFHRRDGFELSLGQGDVT